MLFCIKNWFCHDLHCFVAIHTLLCGENDRYVDDNVVRNAVI